MGEPASPILSAATGLRPGELGLGGVGGGGGPGAALASPEVNGPLTCVAALEVVAGRLLAGGAEGIARRTGDAWHLAQVQGSGAPVVAFLDVRSPAADVGPTEAGEGEAGEDHEVGEDH